MTEQDHLEPAALPLPVAITRHARDLVVVVSGDFDAEAALAVHDAVALGGGCGGDVVLDLGQARRVSDSALAAVASAARTRGVALRLRGISEHHQRVLRMLEAGAPTHAAG